MVKTKFAMRIDNKIDENNDDDRLMILVSIKKISSISIITNGSPPSEGKGAGGEGLLNREAILENRPLPFFSVMSSLLVA